MLNALSRNTLSEAHLSEVFSLLVFETLGFMFSAFLLHFKQYDSIVLY